MFRSNAKGGAQRCYSQSRALRNRRIKKYACHFVPEALRNRAFSPLSSRETAVTRLVTTSGLLSVCSSVYLALPESLPGRNSDLPARLLHLYPFTDT